MKPTLIILIFLLIGCKDSYRRSEIKEKMMNNIVFVVTKDSCEYVVLGDGYHVGGIVHKQNCKYCLQRMKGDTIK